MAIGMTYEQFWNGDNELPRMYRKAYELKMREANQLAWLQGAYVYEAIALLAPALRAFSKGKARDYPDKPFGWEDDPGMDGTGAQEKPKEKSNKNARVFMEMWAINFNEKLAENQQKQSQEKGGEASA